jgi:hypothetical protein
MARRHVLGQVLQGALLFARRQAIPVLHEPLEFLLIDIAAALAAGIADVGRGAARRIDPFRRT